MEVVRIKSKLQISMILAVCEDVPSLVFNGVLCYLVYHNPNGVPIECANVPWEVILSLLISSVSAGYKLSSFQTFFSFRHVLNAWWVASKPSSAPPLAHA